MALADIMSLPQIQDKYGSALAKGTVQVGRYAYFSKQTYPAAGSTSFSFFGDVVGQNSVVASTTNMTRANSFSQRSFLVQAIRTHFYLASSNIKAATLAATQLAMLNDVANSASVFNLKIQDKAYLAIPQPLLYMPFGAGILATASYTLASAADGSMGYGAISPRQQDIFALDPPQLIESEVTFTITIDYAAAVALSGSVTGVIMVVLDGTLFRPVQ